MDLLNGPRKPVLAYAKPTTCHWCSGRFPPPRTDDQGRRFVPVIRKGKDCERYYCSDLCLSRGEERALRYKAALAGTVCSPWYIGAAGVLIVFMLAFTFTGGTRAWAHDPNTHLADGYATARSKKGTLCCDGSDYTYVSPRSWERTQTGYRVHVQGKWVDVPADALVTNMKNPDGEAKVWLYTDGDKPFARCFMPGAES